MNIKALSNFTAKGRRPCQEDHVLADQERGIFVVADGFGGPTAGAMASKTACEAVRNFLQKEAGDLEATLPFVLRNYFSLAGNVLFNALIHANRKVSASNKGKNVHERGGASVIAGFIDGDLLALAAVGACTAWLYRDGHAVELVNPRTYGRLSNPVSPESRPEWRVPLMALGMSEDLEPEIFEYRLKHGDCLLLHTDGIGAEMRERIWFIKQNEMNQSVAAETAVRELSAGAYLDNATASLIFF